MRRSTSSNLAALLGSRICHDLISPLGAISNGVELLELDGAAKGPEIELIGESAGSATARIRLFRVAFGAASAEQRLSAGEVRALIADLTGDGRLAVSWAPPDSLPRREAKAIFLLLQCMEAAMPRGGAIEVREEAGGWLLEGRAVQLRADPDLWCELSAPETGRDMTAAEVQFLLAPVAATEAGRSISVEIGDEAIRIRL